MTSDLLYAAALGAAISDYRRRVRERQPNSGPVIDHMLRNAGIHVPAPWCAAAVQDWTDSAAMALAVKNPLDGVVLEAQVQSYHDWAQKNGKIVDDPTLAKRGHLVLYSFSRTRWDHIGLLLDPPLSPASGSPFTAVEGNTTPAKDGNDQKSREGEIVEIKPRRVIPNHTCFIAWAD